MTREEAIADIRDNIKSVVGGKSLDMAIKALEQELCDKYIKEIDHLHKYISKLETQIVEQEPCEDCISRQAALDAAKDLIVPLNDGTIYKHRCIDPQCIRELPPVQPVNKNRR